MQVLSISALKGGVGKTTLTLGLASAAMQKGLRTLVVDLDPQGNSSHGLGVVGEFNPSAAEVIAKPKHSVILKATLASTWAKGQTGRLDVMVSQPRLLKVNITNPSFKKLWNLEEALSKVEGDYDLVLVDTPPNINALTRMAWVASDRVLIVTEPTIYSVLGVDTALKAFNELRKQVNRQVALFGIVVNRLRPSLAEHQYRINELAEQYPDMLSTTVFEEKSSLSQSQGAGRSIHSWPGQAAAKLAASFDQLLDEVIKSFSADDMRRIEQAKSSRDRNRYAHRTREVPKGEKSKGRRSATSPVEAKPERIEMVETPPVSPEYEDAFNEVLKQTLTRKQLRELKGEQED